MPNDPRSATASAAVVERKETMNNPKRPSAKRGGRSQQRMVRPIAWRDYGLGDYNPKWDGYTAAYYATNAPERGWCLYSRGAGGCWNQRTKPEMPPEPKLQPERVHGEWWWCRPNVCVSDGPADAPQLTRSAEGPFAARNG